MGRVSVQFNTFLHGNWLCPKVPQIIFVSAIGRNEWVIIATATDPTLDRSADVTCLATQGRFVQ
jgi:hypothetical protein